MGRGINMDDVLIVFGQCVIFYLVGMWLFGLWYGWVDLCADYWDAADTAALIFWPITTILLSLLAIYDVIEEFLTSHSRCKMIMKKILFLVFLPIRPVRLGKTLGEVFRKQIGKRKK